jgi:archaellum biogenesis protein FlaJ (TadC family)
MKYVFMAGLLITLPAICVILFLVASNRLAVIPALVSLAINFLPFIVAGLLLRNTSAESLGGH